MWTLPEVLAAVVVGPKDKLVLLLPANVDRQQADDLADAVRERFGEDRVIVVSGPTHLAVLKGTTEPEED